MMLAMIVCISTCTNCLCSRLCIAICFVQKIVARSKRRQHSVEQNRSQYIRVCSDYNFMSITFKWLAHTLQHDCSSLPILLAEQVWRKQLNRLLCSKVHDGCSNVPFKNCIHDKKRRHQVRNNNDTCFIYLPFLPNESWKGSEYMWWTD